MNSRCNRFVFVAGLHRTGTSLLARIIGSHPEISMIEGSGVPENEGCYLQGAIPHTALHGRPGHFATDAQEHHTETSRYNTLETRQRLIADWSPWFEADKRWWIEKSPVNLTRMRLYQQLFPTAQFIVILRPPQVMAGALAKWVDAGPEDLVRYALDAYDRMAADRPYLHSALVLRYEDLVANAETVRRSAFAFLSLADHDPGAEIIDGNDRYVMPETIETGLAARMAKWGYLPGGRSEAFQAIVQHPLRDVREATETALFSSSPTKIEAAE